jgi:uncharacterized membrane protein YdjX (TVP38/TMEM64 family)
MKNKQYYTNKITGALGLIGVVVFFILASYLANTHQVQLQNVITHDSMYGVFFYIFITAFATVIAPISALPLMPVAVSVWGWFITGALSVVGWVLGSQIAFFLARRYGKSLVQKVVSAEKLAQYENIVPEKNIFWTVVLLRMTIPVDVLSYALGLFTSMSHKSYFFATLLGVTPFAFFLAYAGSLPPIFQIGTVTGVLVVLFFVYVLRKK